MKTFLEKLFGKSKIVADKASIATAPMASTEAIDVTATSSKVGTIPRSNAVLALDDKLVDVFCHTFGEKYRGMVSPETDMDAVDEWDSQSFLDLVLGVEEAYGLTFSDNEAAQFFQLGHIQRIVRNAMAEMPHDDVAHACCQLDLLRRAPADEYKLVVLSGSSTREGFLPPAEGLELLRSISGLSNVGWYNISVSGLVAAETLQLIETIQALNNGLVAVGYSPVILGGCGAAEFRRAANHDRFPFSAPQMDRILTESGYEVEQEEVRPSVTVDTWVKRYLKNRELAKLQYEPYLYPTLAPWEAEKYSDEESILRFYNYAIQNYKESIDVNARIFKVIIEYCRRRQISIALLELTLHSRVLAYFEQLGRMVSQADDVRSMLQAEYGVPFVEAVKSARIVDDDFRDPAHIFRKRREYTVAAIEGFLRVAPPRA